MITSITIENFKAVRSIALTLSRITVLVGANNSGKTSIIHGIQFFVTSSQSAKVNSVAVWRGARYETTLGPEQLLWTPTEDAFILAHGAPLTQRRPLKAVFASGNDVSSSITLARGKNRNLRIRIDGATLGQQIQSLDSPFCIYVPGLAGIARSERQLSHGVVRRMVAQGDANLAFRNVLYMLHEDQGKWQLFLQRFGDLFAGYSIVVSFDKNYDEHISVMVRDATGIHRAIDTAGTGMLQVIQLLAYTMLFQPQLLLLDEPDSHLHPNNQRLLCRVLKQLTEDTEMQIVISTHSQHVLEELSDYACLYWVQNGTAVENVDNFEISVLTDLGALGLKDKIISGRTRCLVLTEDHHSDLLKQLLSVSGFKMDETQVVSYNGCTNIVAAEVLHKFVQQLAPGAKTLVHRDRDGMTDGEVQEYINKLSGFGIESFITAGNDVESYYVSPEHISYLIPEVSIERAQEILTSAQNELRETMLAKLVNKRTEHARKRGDAINAGAIAVSANTDLNERPDTFFCGKQMLSRVSGMIQQDLGRNVRLAGGSPFLRTDRLQQLALDFWPSQ